MAKYINTVMAIEALQKGLDVWMWDTHDKQWCLRNVGVLTCPDYARTNFAIGEKPTSPPRKMIEIDGVRMPAPIMRVEDLPESFYVLSVGGEIVNPRNPDNWEDERKDGNVFATEADAIAARDARKLILERAMERAK